MRDLHDCEAPTSLQSLLAEHEETHLWRISRKTKHALMAGLNRLTLSIESLQWSPRLYFGNFSGGAYALAATWKLPDRQCVLVVDGELVLGEIAVWHCPCHLFTDMEQWTAVRPPPGTFLANNCKYVSTDGYGNSNMTGGDLDGDIIFSALLHGSCKSCARQLPSLMKCAWPSLSQFSAI